MRIAPALVTWTVGFLLPAPSIAGLLVWVCEGNQGTLSVTHFVDQIDPVAGLERLHSDGTIADPARCWSVDPAILPPRHRPDPRVSGEFLAQRHRWRRGPSGTVIVDPTVMRPDKAAVLRQFAKEIPPPRRAAILATQLGSNLHQALREGDFPLARALMGHIAARAGTAQEIMTAAEVALVRAIARDYEADLEEGSP